MFFVYPAIFHKEENSYWVEFPDLEGCQTFADTLEEAAEMAQEALSGYLITTLEEKNKLKNPSEIKDIKCDKDSFTSLVTCDIGKYLNNSKAIKKTLTIPEWLNDMAVANGINFSAILQEALIEKLEITK